jgi:hypothetical protein
LSYPSSKNPFSRLTASPGLAAAAGPGWQISIGGAAERRSVTIDRIGLVDRELRREGVLSISLLDIKDWLDPVTEAMSSSISKYSGSDCSPQKFSSPRSLLGVYSA